ncbi:carbonic anhydrase family protein [Neobacillus niacini]|uniref:carbonic anhydrase n=1 Tax=Neobacillus niacini TaxID=86668 RepID=UPI002866610F|nr:carbonic anhydrase family protein [Neobacillus niacini]MDR7002162.1 carbonic anhydrase [Neobacillus niacini]
MKNKLFYKFLAVSLSIPLCACSVQTQDTTEPKEEKASREENKHSTQWSYEGETSPKNWGKIDTLNSQCVNGKEQSPINIEISKVQPNQALDDVKITYQPTVFTFENNGHTVQANTIELNNSIVVEGTEYKLAQFHFHQPSEHQFNRKNFEMEIHLVHQDKNNRLAVLGIMIKEGSKNKSLAEIWGKLPKEETKEGIKLIQPIDLTSLLPKSQKSFRYNGSLTTPPCSEKVKWVVLEQPIEMSKAQIDAYRKIFPDNHRPVQPLNERDVQTSNL